MARYRFGDLGALASLSLQRHGTQTTCTLLANVGPDSLLWSLALSEGAAIAWQRLVQLYPAYDFKLLSCFLISAAAL